MDKTKLQKERLKEGYERENASQSSEGQEKRVLVVMRGLTSLWAESNRDCWRRTRSFRSFSCLSWSMGEVGLSVLTSTWVGDEEIEDREWERESEVGFVGFVGFG